MSKGLEAWLGLTEWMVNQLNKITGKEIDKDYFTAYMYGTEINGIPTCTVTKELEALDIIKKSNKQFKEMQIGTGYGLTINVDINNKEEFDLLKEVLFDES